MGRPGKNSPNNLYLLIIFIIPQESSVFPLFKDPCAFIVVQGISQVYYIENV